LPVQDRLDLVFTKNGDYSLSSIGNDFRDTSFAAFESVKQEVRTRVCSITKDWVFYPTITANLDLVIGKPNNKETGLFIEGEVRRALSHDSFISAKDLKVRAFPLSNETIGIMVMLTVINEETREYETTELMFTATSTEINPQIISVN